MSWDQYLFGFRGRINRARYWQFVGLSMLIWVVAVALIVAGSAMGLSIKPGTPGATNNLIAFGILLAALLLFYVYSSIAIVIKRLHDRDKSGWWVLPFQLLPVFLNILGQITSRSSPGGGAVGAPLALIAFGITIWAFVEIGCLRGTNGDNRYGQDPLADPQDTAAAFA